MPIARIDQLAAARPAVGPSPIVGSPSLAASFSYSASVIRSQAGLGDVRQRAGRGFDVFLAQDVAHADAQLLGVLEAVQDRVDIFGPAAQFGQRVRRATRSVGSLSSTRLSISSSSMPGLLIRMPDRYWLDEHSSTYKCSVGGLKLNSSHSTPLPPSESLTLLEVDQRRSRGRAWRRWPCSSCGAIAARKCRQRRVERKRIFSVASAIRF